MGVVKFKPFSGLQTSAACHPSPFPQLSTSDHTPRLSWRLCSSWLQILKPDSGLSLAPHSQSATLYKFASASYS